MKNNYICRIFSTPKLLAFCLVFMLGMSSVVGQTIKIPGTFSFVVPAGITRLTIECWGAGGAGGGSNSNNNGGSGGGAGAYAIRTYTVVPGQVITYTVGAGGTSAVAADGTDGGQSYVTSTAFGFTPITAGGGKGGKKNKGAYGTGGTASGGSTNTVGGNGIKGTTWGEKGGDCPNGGTGGSRIQDNPGNPGNAPGGGGGGGEKGNGTNYAGGKGGDGQVRFNWAPTIVVGYKSDIQGTDDFVIDGTYRQYSSAKLLNPLNFGGPNATSPFSFVMYDFGSNPITEEALIANGVQILDLGIQNMPDGGSGTSATSYTIDEINAIKKWTISSTRRVVLGFQGFSTALGGALYVTDGVNNDNPNSLTSIGQNILSGPFGTTNSFDQGGTYRGTFGVPPATSCVLSQDNTGDPTGLINNITGDIYLADIGMISRPEDLPNLLTLSNNITSNGDRFFANLYHGMARIVQYGPDLVCDFFSCLAGINPPSLNATSINIQCPATTVNLSSIFTGTPPAGSVLKWYDNSSHTGSPVADPTNAPAGTYYAFFVDPNNNCFSPTSLPILVEPGISITSTSLSGFSYIVGNGPSAAQTFYVTGSCLTEGITVTPPANYEIWNGTSYQSTPIILPQSGGNVNSTAVQIRLIAGLAVGDYPATLILSSNGATSKYVALSGTVTNDYCISTGNTTYNTSITLVRFNTINNVSPKPSGYSDYTTTHFTNVNTGSPYYLTVNLNTGGTYTIFCKAWIDWNRDGIFNNTDESYDLGSTTNKVDGQTSLSPLQITIPIGASVGLTRMRISCKWNSSPGECETGFDGEVEDYGVNIQKNFWRGNFSQNWGTSENWTASYVPLTGDDVVYSTGDPYSIAVRDLILDTDRTIGNLTNATTKNLEIPAGKGLRVNGTITTDNNPDRILIKSAVSTPNGSLIFPNASNVNATVEMYSKAYKEPTPIIINGTPYSYNWQFFGVPVRSITAQPTFDGSYVREYKQDKQGLYTKWDQLNNASVLKPFKGYEITQDETKTLYFKGVLVNNDTTISLPISNDPLVYFRGQHLLSNPYTAAIDVRQLEFGANTEKTVYLYNTGSFGAWVVSGGGSTYDDNSSTAGQYIAIPQRAAGLSSNLPNDIPSMSGFLVKSTDSTNYSPGSITIRYNSLMITNNVNPQRVKANTNDNTNEIINADLISTKIDLTGLHYSDRMWIFIEPSCSKKFDNGWDGRKMLGSSLAPQIYAVEPDGDYQVSTVNDMNNTDIAFQPGDEVEYTLKFTHDNIKNMYAGVYLVDLLENKTIEITESGTTYKFATAPASQPTKRFKIIARHYEKDAADKNTSLKVFSARNAVYVQNFGTEIGECTLYDIAGRAVKKLSFGPNSVTAVSNSLVPGAYVVSALSNGEKVSKRVIVQ